MARLEGFEPPTNGFGSRYSIRLSYRRETCIVLDSRRSARACLTSTVYRTTEMSESSEKPLPTIFLSGANALASTGALVRGDRPIGWLLLLWPTWWGLWLAADGVPPWWILIVFTLGVWLTRSAGCVINDYADRWLDPQVERTKGPAARQRRGARSRSACWCSQC